MTLDTSEYEALVAILDNAPMHRLRIATRKTLRAYQEQGVSRVTLDVATLEYLATLTEGTRGLRKLHRKVEDAAIRAERNRRQRGVGNVQARGDVQRRRRARHNAGRGDP
jgi:hypothetical protein